MTGPGDFDLRPPRRVRRPSLTPLIDVVFLLLVFFMLVARFGTETALRLDPAAGGGVWQGPPRLIEIGTPLPRLNGVPVPIEDLAEAVGALTETPEDPIVLRAGAGADVQALATVLTRLQAAGHRRLVVME